MIAEDDFVLRARELPPQSNLGYFVMGAGTNTFVPVGSVGRLCVMPGLIRLLPPTANTAEEGGGFTRTIRLTSGPAADFITSGSTWSFQAWYRDRRVGTTNFTDAVGIQFQ